MASRLQVGSSRAFLTFVGFLLVVASSIKFRIIEHAVTVLLLAFLLIGSVVILIRMWRTRGSLDQFWKSAHGGQTAFLPPKWRRWVLGEDDPR
jgi:hypothetical protein